MNRNHIIGLFLIACGALAPSSSAQLNPPGGPVLPTNRTPVNQQTIGAFPYVISQPGSYVLTSNLIAAGATPVLSVIVSDVTVDLNGFSIVNGTFGIELAPGIRDIAISNGVVSANSDTGIEGPSVSQVRLTDLRINSNGGRGAYVGDGAVISRCTAQTNARTGLRLGNYGVVTDCFARDNGVGPGIFAQSFASIVGCTTTGNGQGGIAANQSSTIDRCTATSNGSAAPGTWDGIFAEQGSTIRGCTADFNTRFGIVLQARGNVLDSSAKDNADCGIAVGFASTVQRCTAHDNGAIEGRSGARHVTSPTLANRANRPTRLTPGTTPSALDGELAFRASSGQAAVRGAFIADGISCGDGCTVIACDAQGNADAGIAVVDTSTIIGCTVRFNQGAGIETLGSTTIRDCTATQGYASGIEAGDGSTVERCTLALNALNGITMTGNTTVRGCTADANSLHGFDVTGARNRLEDNQALNNLNFGFNVTGFQNVLNRNSASANLINYSIVGGNNHGSIMFLFGGGPFFSNEPWANFEH